MGRGGWLSNVGGAHLFFLHSLMGIFFFFFSQGPWPPQAIMWLRPCSPNTYADEKFLLDTLGL